MKSAQELELAPEERRQQVVKLLKEFTQGSDEYSLSHDFWYSGHREGDGGESISTYTVKRGEESVLEVKIKDPYYTTSDDFFDHDLPPEIVSIKLTGKLGELYEKLRLSANFKT